MPPSSTCAPKPARVFTDTERQALHDVIAHRRDVRNEFLPDPIEPSLLRRILEAAHRAPSVGLSQPWNFILIRDPARKADVKAIFDRANDAACAMFPEARQSDYARLKLEGIEKAPLNIVVTCDRRRGGQVVLGKTQNPEMDLYSTVCAVQNLWLAARAEGVGMGWVSIYDKAELSALFALPENVEIVAYLCLGHVSDMFDGPELEARGWARAESLDAAIMEECWQG